MNKRTISLFLFISLLNDFNLSPVFAVNTNQDARVSELLDEAARHKSFNQIDPAIQKYEEARQLKPDDPRVLEALGTLYFEKGEYEKSAGFLKASISSDGKDPLTHFYLAESFVKTGSAQVAEEEYKTALALDPNLVEAEYGLALLLEGRGDIDQAKAHYRSVTLKNPTHAGAFFQLGSIAYQEGDFVDAKQFFEQAVLFDPKMMPAHYNLGVIYMKLKDFEKAREEFKKAITLDPSNPAAFFQVAVAYEEQGFLHEAEAGYEEALHFNPNWEEAKVRLENIRNRIAGETDRMNETREPTRSIPIFSGSFGKGGFQAGTPFDPLGALPGDNTGSPKLSSKALLFQAGATLLQQWLNSRSNQQGSDNSVRN